MRRASLPHRAALVVAAWVSAVAIVPGVAFTVAQPWHVEGASMEPSLHDGSVLLVDAVGPRVGGYGRGDIVVLPLPASLGYPHPILVKRIVALAGDHVVIDDGRVAINGREPAEPYLPPGTVTPVPDRRDIVGQAGAVFGMGDHRENSYDSKAFGPVPLSTLVGRAWLAIAPGGRLELPGAAAGGE